jgi:outer membrane protein assembly factor BamB
VGSEDFFFYAIDAGTGAVRWKFETKLGVSSSPAASQELVVFGSKDGNLYALDIPTGKLNWKLSTGRAITSPTVICEPVVAVNAEGTAMCLDIASGKVLWKAGLGGGTPVLAGGRTYVASHYGTVYALE